MRLGEDRGKLIYVTLAFGEKRKQFSPDVIPIYFTFKNSSAYFLFQGIAYLFVLNSLGFAL